MSDRINKENGELHMARNLVIYYSRSGQNYVDGEIVELEKGNTELVAEYIRDAVGADLFRIEPAKPYPEDYKECTEVAKKELRESARPKLKEYLSDVRDYDNIVVAGPCWWGTYPMAMFTLLEELDFAGGKVFPVMTHEGSGLGSAERDLKRMCRHARVKRGLAVQGSLVAESEARISDWARKNAR